MSCYSFFILFNKSLYEPKFLFLKSIILHQFKREKIIFCFRVPLYYMDMYWRMVISIKQKPISKKYKYSWHVSFNLQIKVIFLLPANIFVLLTVFI